MSSGNETVEDVHRQYTADRLDEILVRVTAINGRIGKLEIATAVLQVGYVVGAAIIGALFNHFMGKLP